MAVYNPMHLSEGRRVRIHRKDGSRTRGTLLHNDNQRRVLCLEIAEGFFEQVAYDDIDRTQTWLKIASKR